MIDRHRGGAALGALLMGGVLLAGAGPAGAAGHATPADPAIAAAEHVCSSCHGFEGRSVSPQFPRLAGQQRDYLIAQLKRFRDHSRAEEQAHIFMWGMAGHLDDQAIAGLAGWYASQKPEAGQPGDPAEVARGKAIFENGIGAPDSPPCRTCHGEDAEGSGAVPRLAGQHRAYLEAQILNFQSKARANEIMHQTSRGLTEQQIRDVATYLESK